MQYHLLIKLLQLVIYQLLFITNLEIDCFRIKSQEHVVSKNKNIYLNQIIIGM